MNTAKYKLKIIAINMILIFAVLGVFTTGPFLVIQMYHFLQPQPYEKPMVFYDQEYSWLYDHLDDWAKLDSEYKDYVVWTSKPLASPSVNISEKGVRRTILAEKIDGKEPRYLFFGASSMVGYGSPDALTIPSIFSEINQVETINYGVGGYEVRQCLSYLANLYIENQINDKRNIIIFDNGIIAANNQYAIRTFDLTTTQESKIKEAIKSHSTLEAAYFLRPALEVMGRLRSKRHTSEEPSKMPAEQEKTAVEFVAEATVRTWLMASRLANGFNDDFVAVFSPHNAMGNPDLRHLPKLNNEDRMNFIRLVHDSIVARAAMFPELKFIDLTDIFDIPASIYIDQDGHLSPKGNRIFAEQLTKRLQHLRAD